MEMSNSLCFSFFLGASSGNKARAFSKFSALPVSTFYIFLNPRKNPNLLFDSRETKSKKIQEKEKVIGGGGFEEEDE